MLRKWGLPWEHLSDGELRTAITAHWVEPWVATVVLPACVRFVETQFWYWGAEAGADARQRDVFHMPRAGTLAYEPWTRCQVAHEASSPGDWWTPDATVPVSYTHLRAHET